MTSEIHTYDLARYGVRIGYEGPWEPTLDVLRAILARHALAIPFENVGVLMGDGISLNPTAVERKIVAGGRGGYCFEQNGMMLGILEQIGFPVRPLSARVRAGAPREFTPPRTHLFLAVAAEGSEWVFDVGVGSASLTSPLRLGTEDAQETLHEPRRIVFEEGRYFHQLWTGTAWMDLYEFTGEEMPAIDRELANWFTSTHPESKFRKNLMCARALPNGERLNLMNRELTHRRGGEVLSERILSSHDDLLDVLRGDLGLQLPDDAEIKAEGLDWN